MIFLKKQSQNTKQIEALKTICNGRYWQCELESLPKKVRHFLPWQGDKEKLSNLSNTGRNEMKWTFPLEGENSASEILFNNYFGLLNNRRRWNL